MSRYGKLYTLLLLIGYLYFAILIVVLCCLLLAQFNIARTHMKSGAEGGWSASDSSKNKSPRKPLRD